MKSSFIAPAIAGGLVALMLAGCSPANSIDYSKVELLSVGGTVTLDGAPLAGAVITFDNLETGTFAFARTDASGGYSLMFDSEKKGCSPGKKTVQISTTRTVLGLPGEDGVEEGEQSSEAGSGKGKEEEKVPKCYNKESKLTVEVTPSKTTFNFDLKSDCSTSGVTP